MQGVSTTIRLVDQMTAPIMSINNAINNLIDGFHGVENASDVDAASLDVMRRQVDMANFAADQLNQQFLLVQETIERMDQEQSGFNDTVREGQGAADKLMQKIGGVVAAYASIQGVKTVLGLSDELTQTTARLNMMNDGMQTTEELQKMIFDSAERSRGSYQATADAVGKIGTNARDAFSSNGELVAFAEQLNKHFSLAGTSAQGAEAATLQLTQAMGSGVLRGEELNSIYEQTPSIIQAIADYLNIPSGQIRAMAEDGKITASIVKNAMLSAADETNAQFEEMPKTFAQVATSIKNHALMAFQPVLNRLSEIANSPAFQTLVDNINSALVVVADVVLSIFDAIGAIAQFATDNWSWLAPVIGTVAAAMAAYVAIIIIYNIVQGISNALKAASVIASYAMAAATGTQVTATTAQTAAQLGLNTAMLACPLTWILVAIALVIGAIYLFIPALNNAAGTSVSATGIIFGAFSTLGAFLWNLFLGVFELILGGINGLVAPFIIFANFIGNVFKNPISSVIYLFQGMADRVLAILQTIASAIDFVFGSNLAGAVAGWRSGLKGMADAAVEKYAPDENYQNVVDNLNLSVEGMGLKRKAYGDAWDTGYAAGQSVEDAIAGLGKSSSGGGAPPPAGAGNYGAPPPLPDGLGDDVSGIKSNTGKQLEYSEEDIKLWRAIAERDAINRFTTAEVKVDFGGIQNNVSSDMDLDGIVDYLGEKVEGRLLEVAEGVHV